MKRALKVLRGCAHNWAEWGGKIRCTKCGATQGR
jgi:hypothetical protein